MVRAHTGMAGPYATHLARGNQSSRPTLWTPRSKTLPTPRRAQRSQIAGGEYRHTHMPPTTPPTISALTNLRSDMATQRTQQRLWGTTLVLGRSGQHNVSLAYLCRTSAHRAIGPLRVESSLQSRQTQLALALTESHLTTRLGLRCVVQLSSACKRWHTEPHPEDCPHIPRNVGSLHSYDPLQDMPRLPGETCNCGPLSQDLGFSVQSDSCGEPRMPRSACLRSAAQTKRSCQDGWATLHERGRISATPSFCAFERAAVPRSLGGRKSPRATPSVRSPPGGPQKRRASAAHIGVLCDPSAAPTTHTESP